MDLDRSEKISITIVYDGDEIEVKTFKGEYRNLMALIADHIYADNFGECGGMGRCATCMAEIVYSESLLPPSDRNEYTTLSKHGVEEANIRLTCQLNIERSLNNIKVKILYD